MYTRSTLWMSEAEVGVFASFWVVNRGRKVVDDEISENLKI